MNESDLYSFDMEYVPGKSFYEFFSTSNKKDIDFVVETLFEYFDFLSSRFVIVDVTDKVVSKLESLYNQTQHKEFLKFLLTKQVSVPYTFCHGDLTFNNILFHHNRLFLIDFLDSYVDSFLCDLVKIKQDLQYFWNLKIHSISSLRIVQTYQYIWRQIEERYEYFMNDSFDVLDAVNILRIEPYLTNSHQRSILDKVITSTKLYENFNSSNGR